MKILSWNCRGLSNPRAIPNLRHLAQRHRPDILFLSETLAKTQKLENIRVSLKYECCLSVDVEGRSRGLAVLWNNSAKCSIVNFSRNFINLMVQDELKGEWRLTCYYGFPERSRRKEAWDMLRELRDMSVVPWCVIGDFNDLLSQQDKLGIHPHPNWLCVGFREAVSDCNLKDISLEGHPFTWIKSRRTPQAIEERLDRALGTTEWLEIFPDASLVNLLASHSDHSPILLHCNKILPKRRTKYSFKFENAWLTEEDLKDVVMQGWNRDGTEDVLHRIANVTTEMANWSKIKHKQKYVNLNLHMATMEAAHKSNDTAAGLRFPQVCHCQEKVPEN